MKKASPNILLILCIVLAAALLLSVGALISAKAEAKAATEQLQILSDRLQTLETENATLRLQQGFLDSVWTPVEGESDYHCTLMVESWSVENTTLSVSTFAQAVLAPDAVCSAQLELRLGNTVIASQPIDLNAGEAEGIFEADTAVSFSIPEISADEELQLWLIVESAGSDTLYACGAGWYQEDGHLLLITG